MKVDVPAIATLPSSTCSVLKKRPIFERASSMQHCCNFLEESRDDGVSGMQRCSAVIQVLLLLSYFPLVGEGNVPFLSQSWTTFLCCTVLEVVLRGKGDIHLP